MIDVKKKYKVITRGEFLVMSDVDGNAIPFQVDIKIKQGCMALGNKQPIYVSVLCNYDNNGIKIKSSVFEEVKRIRYEFVGYTDGMQLQDIEFEVHEVMEGL